MSRFDRILILLIAALLALFGIVCRNQIGKQIKAHESEFHQKPKVEQTDTQKHEAAFHKEPVAPQTFVKSNIDENLLDEHYDHIRRGETQICNLCH